MRVLMVGATGSSVGVVLPELLARGVTVRALVRDQDRGVLASRRGAQEVAIGDLADPESLLRAAQGVDGVFHVNPAFAADEAAWGCNMVAAAVEAGVGRFVFSSVYHPSLSLVNHADKRPVEEAVYRSGMAFTVLQPAMYVAMVDSSFASARDSGRIRVPYSPDVPLAFVDYRDVAEVAGVAMTTDALVGGTFELAAPGTTSWTRIAAQAAELLGREVVAEKVDPGPPPAPGSDPMREGLAAMLADYDRYGFDGGNAAVLRALLGREPRTVLDRLRELAGASPS